MPKSSDSFRLVTEDIVKIVPTLGYNLDHSYVTIWYRYNYYTYIFTQINIKMHVIDVFHKISPH